MKRFQFIGVFFILFAATLASGEYERELTEEQALEIIEAYKIKEAAAEERLLEEQQKLEEIQVQIREIDAEILALETKIAEVKKTKEVPDLNNPEKESKTPSP